MTDIALPNSTFKILSGYVANAVESAGGRAKVAALLGLDESTLSKACRENYTEMLSRNRLLLLGVSGGGADLARFFASYSHVEVVPFDDGPSAGAVSNHLISAIGKIAKEHSEAIHALVGAAERGTPSAYREAMKEISELNRELDQVVRTLASTMAQGS